MESGRSAIIYQREAYCQISTQVSPDLLFSIYNKAYGALPTSTKYWISWQKDGRKGGDTPVRAVSDVTIGPRDLAIIDMRRRIEGGDWAVGETIPDSAELSEQYPEVGPSGLTTLRKVLSKEGLLEVTLGRNAHTKVVSIRRREEPSLRESIASIRGWMADIESTLCDIESRLKE